MQGSISLPLTWNTPRFPWEQAQRIIAASQSEGVPCLPRPVSHSNDWIKPLLESGADGLLVQMVDTPGD